MSENDNEPAANDGIDHIETIEKATKKINSLTHLVNAIAGFIKSIWAVILIILTIVGFIFQEDLIKTFNRLTSEQKADISELEIPDTGGLYQAVNPEELAEAEVGTLNGVSIFKNETKVIERLPTYFYNTKFNQQFNWYRLKGENVLSEDVEVSINVMSTDSSMLRFTDESSRKTSTINANSSIDETMRPVYQYLGKESASGDNSRAPLARVSLVVEEARTKKRIFKQDYEIQLMPPNELAWDLQTVEGEFMPKKHLILSMAAWSNTKDPKADSVSQLIVNQIQQDRTGDSLVGAEFMTAWFERFYDQQMKGNNVTANTPFFIDLEGSLRIDPPGVVMEDLSKQLPVQIIDLALLIGSMSSEISDIHKVNVIFLVSKVDPGTEYFVAWGGQGNWNAINLGNTRDSFTVNSANSKPVVEGLLNRNDVLRGLLTEGVWHEDNQLVALHFEKSRHNIGQGGLP